MISQQQNDLLCRTGPGTPMGDLFRRFWLPVALSREFPKQDSPPVRLRILSEDLIAFRDTNGKVGLLARYCPHRGASLFFGRNEERGLRCVYHGWKFDVNGVCIDMPNEPAECTFKHKIRQTAYPTREAGGVVWAYMGPQASMPELPQLEWTLVPQNHVYVHKRFQHCNYLQNVEGEVVQSRFLSASRVPAGKIQRCYRGASVACSLERSGANVPGARNGVWLSDRSAA